jgi:hypothetical protein
MRVYIAGPMSGQPEWNYSAFYEAENRLEDWGFDPVNPARHFRDPDNAPSWRECLRKAIRAMMDCEAVVVLPGWQESKGAVLEVDIARALGWEVLALEEDGLTGIYPVPESVNAEADRLVNGPRQNSYGHPLDDFTKTAKMWTGLLHGKLIQPITAEEVGLAMICVKLAREQNAPKRDNLVDAAGYAATVQMVKDERRRR